MPRIRPRNRVPSYFLVLRAAILAALAVLPIAVAAPARQPDPLATVLSQIDTAGIDAHLRFLSHDLLNGRAPGTRGGRLATLYLESEFRRIGLAPAFGGSFLQSVPLVARALDPAASRLEFQVGGRVLMARHADDVVVWTPSADVATASGEVVFAGFGIDAPEHEWDDFGDADLRGKLLLVLVNEPPPTPDAPTRFDGRALTYYGRWTYKLEEAARRGAAGALIVHSPESAGYPWSVVQGTWTGERLHLRNESTAVDVEGWISQDFATRLLAAAGLDFRELVHRAHRPDFRPVSTGIRARLELRGRSRRVDAYNVAGVLRGAHPELRDEVVVYTAHFDGLGVGVPVAGDSIYNGAYDNASGVAALIEIAEAFALPERPPERSILFLATTGEEAGLLGARSYVRAPAFPLERTVLAINIDGANVWGETHDATVLGMERSTFRSVIEGAALALGLRLVPDRAPELGRLFRSDVLAFAQTGVPALQVEHGVEFRDRSLGWGANVVRRYSEMDYHRPSDEYDPDFDLSGAVQQARLAFLIGYGVATGTPREVRRALPRSGLLP